MKIYGLLQNLRLTVAHLLPLTCSQPCSKRLLHVSYRLAPGGNAPTNQSGVQVEERQTGRQEHDPEGSFILCTQNTKKEQKTSAISNRGVPHRTWKLNNR